MAEQHTPGIEAAQFLAPTTTVDSSGDLSTKPTPAEQYTYLRDYYQTALLDGRNDGFKAFRAFFPPEPDQFAERASGVTSEELLTFSKKMNERWTAANPPNSRFIHAYLQQQDAS